MYTIKELESEIAVDCDELVSNGETPKNWVIQSVLKSHSDVHGDDADMALCCMRETVASRVNKHFSKIKAAEQETPQMPLPGFEKLQQRYVITRDKEQSIVSIYHMTDEELEAKAEELEAMAEGCLKDADEIRKFRTQRQQVV